MTSFPVMERVLRTCRGPETLHAALSNLAALPEVGMTSTIGPKVPRLLGVVGAGQMGAGIAQVAAVTGVPVVLADANQESLERGVASIQRNIARQVQKKQLTQQEADQASGRIRTALSLKVMVHKLVAVCSPFFDPKQLCRPWNKLTLSLKLSVRVKS